MFRKYLFYHSGFHEDQLTDLPHNLEAPQVNNESSYFAMAAFFLYFHLYMFSTFVYSISGHVTIRCFNFPQVLNRVIRAIDFHPGFKKIWRKIFLSEPSIAILW